MRKETPNFLRNFAGRKCHEAVEQEEKLRIEEVTIGKFTHPGG